jgi:hypothetical protein
MTESSETVEHIRSMIADGAPLDRDAVAQLCDEYDALYDAYLRIFQAADTLRVDQEKTSHKEIFSVSE